MSALDKFGQFVVLNLRDRLLEQNEMLMRGKLKGRAIQELQERVAALNDDQRKVVRAVLVDAIDTAIHDFLFAIQDAHDRNLGVEVFVDGENVAEVSGVLNGEHLGEDGWIRRYSHFSNLDVS